MFQRHHHGLSKMAIPLFHKALNPKKITILWIPCDEQLSGILGGSLKPFPHPKRFQRPGLHSIAVISFSFCGNICSTQFLPWSVALSYVKTIRPLRWHSSDKKHIFSVIFHSQVSTLFSEG